MNVRTTQPSRLFDPEMTRPKRCYACGTREPAHCKFNRDVRSGLRQPSERKPQTCLIRYDPAAAEIPY